MLRSFLGLCVLLLLPGVCSAHKPSDSYLRVVMDGAALTAEWQISLKDLDYVLHLDSDGNGLLTWGEVAAAKQRIEIYALNRLLVTADDRACSPAGVTHLLDRHSDGAYLVLRFALDCPADSPQSLILRYDLFFEEDLLHRGLVDARMNGAGSFAVLSPELREHTFALAAADNGFSFFVSDGIHHIWTGYDHVLFLIALLLPSVLRHRKGRWEGAASYGDALHRVLLVVTAFTVAHSLTLGLAVTGVVELPSRLVESVIALSVVIAALLNIFPLAGAHRSAALAFGFGLMHGFGFAGVMSDFGLSDARLLSSLLGFNLGVELGQLVIVAAFFPCAYLLRKTSVYRYGVLLGGSAAIALLSAAWFIERAFLI